VRLARYVLEQDAHVMLSGREALELALRLGHEPAVVATPAKIRYWQEHLDEAFESYARRVRKFGGLVPGTASG